MPKFGSLVVSERVRHLAMLCHVFFECAIHPMLKTKDSTIPDVNICCTCLSTSQHIEIAGFGLSHSQFKGFNGAKTCTWHVYKVMKSYIKTTFKRDTENLRQVYWLIPFITIWVNKLLQVSNMNASAIKGDDSPIFQPSSAWWGRTVRSWWNLPRTMYCTKSYPSWELMNLDLT